jgi:hypothetical protein
MNWSASIRLSCVPVSIQPGIAAAQDLHAQLLMVQVVLIDGGDLQLAPGQGLDVGGGIALQAFGPTAMYTALFRLDAMRLQSRSVRLSTSAIRSCTKEISSTTKLSSMSK